MEKPSLKDDLELHEAFEIIMQLDDRHYVFLFMDFEDSEKGKEFNHYITKDIFGNGDVYTSIKNNMVIEFRDFAGSRMTYTDAHTEKIARDIKKQKDLEKANKSASEF